VPLTIIELSDMTSVNKGVAQIADGQALAASDIDHTGSYTVTGENTRFIKIVGQGTITWSNDVVEPFSGTEYRGVRPAMTFEVA